MRDNVNLMRFVAKDHTEWELPCTEQSVTNKDGSHVDTIINLPDGTKFLFQIQSKELFDHLRECYTSLPTTIFHEHV